MLKLIDRVAYRGAFLGGWVALILMGLTFIDVWARLFFSRPVPAAYEISEAVIIPALVYLSMARGNHITVDWVIERLSGRSLLMVEIIRHLISIVFTSLIFMGAVMAARGAFAQNLTSEAVVAFPVWPSYWVVAAGLGCLMLVRITLLMKLLLARPK